MAEANRIKGIFFDFDGVITCEKNGSPTIIAYISEKTNIPYEIVDLAYRKYNEDLLRGNITHRDMWEPFCKEIGCELDYEILEKSFLNIKLDQQMVKLIKDIKKNYLIGMITDNKVDRIRAIIENTELKELFDVIIISADVHARKTEENIFEEALKQSGLQARECVFIDNTAANLLAPREMGFHTIFFDDEKRDYTEIQNI